MNVSEMPLKKILQGKGALIKLSIINYLKKVPV
jgi:hypothetical protein